MKHLLKRRRGAVGLLAVSMVFSMLTPTLLVYAVQDDVNLFDIGKVSEVLFNKLDHKWVNRLSVVVIYFGDLDGRVINIETMELNPDEIIGRDTVAITTPYMDAYGEPLVGVENKVEVASDALMVGSCAELGENSVFCRNTIGGVFDLTFGSDFPQVISDKSVKLVAYGPVTLAELTYSVTGGKKRLLWMRNGSLRYARG